MKAVINSAYVKERVILANVLPLSTPYRMTISPIQRCNFKCFYCTHSLDEETVKKTGFNYTSISYESFVQLADQMRAFPEKIKLVVFSGMGEPLLNKDLPKMINYLKDNDICDRVEMYSNASALTQKWSDRLIESGLDGFKVSLQGLDFNAYKEICGFSLNFEKFMKNIEYLYQNRGKCKVYIKVVDSALRPEEDGKFYSMFGDLCDEIFIEHLSECQPLTGDCGGLVNNIKTMYNEDAKFSKVCPLLFYSLYVDSDLDVYPCVTLALPKSFSVGNIKNMSLCDIWNGDKIRRLRIQHLKGLKDENPTCRGCGNMAAMYHQQDDLDSESQRLLSIFDDECLIEDS